MKNLIFALLFSAFSTVYSMENTVSKVNSDNHSLEKAEDHLRIIQLAAKRPAMETKLENNNNRNFKKNNNSGQHPKKKYVEHKNNLKYTYSTRIKSQKIKVLRKIEENNSTNKKNKKVTKRTDK